MTLQDAIKRSISHNEIVHCEWAGGDESDLVAELLSLIPDGCDVDSVRENDGTIDAWGSLGDPDLDWRLRVTLTK